MLARVTRLSKPVLPTVAVLALGLTACSTSADVFYGGYQAGPGYETGRIYENRIYGDTRRGFGNENCRTVLRRQVDTYGRASSVEDTVCN